MVLELAVLNPFYLSFVDCSSAESVCYICGTLRLYLALCEQARYGELSECH